MEDHEMALLNELEETTPDLTWPLGTLDATWTKEDVDLGSDHSVIGITIRGSRYRAVLGKTHITDRDKMRKVYPRLRRGVRGGSKTI
ncbi:hypothetical protein MRX96_031750 [Rhipicephalus microplus]